MNGVKIEVNIKGKEKRKESRVLEIRIWTMLTRMN